MNNRPMLLRAALTVAMVAIASAAFAAGDLQMGIEKPIVKYLGPSGEVLEGKRCITVDRGDPSLLRAPEDMERWLEDFRSGHKAETTINVPVWIHNIYYTSGGNNVGYVTDAMATDQMAVLNGAYNSLGYNFVLYGTDRYKSRRYSSWDLGSADEALVKQYLSIWPQYVLNIYAIQPPGGTLGWAYFPWSYPQDHTLHGVVLLSQSMPGGGAAPYDEGDTGTHEVGHWAGLYHTFQGGCFGNGDFVADTPPQGTPSFGCPIGKNTCAGGGPDPIHNFMDYSDDSCMFEFTQGQNDRIDWAMSTYRPLMGTVGKHQIDFSSRGLPREFLDDEFTPQVANAAREAGIQISATPNPFNPRTEIRFSLRTAGAVEVQLYDAKGRRVMTVFEGHKAGGDHSVSLDGRSLASGVYHAVIRSGDASSSTRLTLLK